VSQKLPENQDSKEKQSVSEKVPGRAVGFSTMSILIILVSVWMSLQSGSNRTADSEGRSDLVSIGDVPGFDSDAWYLPEDNLLGFVEITAGEFTMGSNPALDRLAYENERWSNLQRQGTVELPIFYINRFETTQAQFSAFLEDTNAESEVSFLSAELNSPVNNITWPEAVAYTQWLDGKLRSASTTPARLKSMLDAGAKVTLPTEAEWEKAARGTDGRIFPWGSQPTSEFANFSAEEPRTVGAVACNSCANGLMDMAGNVWEMTRSPFQDYPYDPADDADKLEEDALWIMRGGSFADGLNNIRTAVRGGVDPGVRNRTIGFRVVISQP
jgi:formylglycine-generating enzyme required for sulfatase activity